MSSNEISNEETHGDRSYADAVHQIRTAGSISISPELFEKLYLSPQNAVKGDLRKTFGNPTSLAVVGFVMSLFPLSMQLMNWRGTGGAGVGSATIGVYFFMGGLLCSLGAVGEWILGNTFPMVVFGTFGGFWLAFGATLQPFYNAVEAYKEPMDFYNAFGFFLISFGMLALLFLICSLRTNIAFVVIFFTLVCAVGFLAGSYWQLTNGNADLALKLQKGAGGFLFVCCLSGWWILVAVMLAILDFPFGIPVGELSTVFRGVADSRKITGSKV